MKNKQQGWPKEWPTNQEMSDIVEKYALMASREIESLFRARGVDDDIKIDIGYELPPRISVGNGTLWELEALIKKWFTGRGYFKEDR